MYTLKARDPRQTAEDMVRRFGHERALDAAVWQELQSTARGTVEADQYLTDVRVSVEWIIIENEAPAEDATVAERQVSRFRAFLDDYVTRYREAQTEAES